MAEASLTESESVDPGALELEHSRLMGLQGRGISEDDLIPQVQSLAAQIRALGTSLNDHRARNHWQGVLSYWSIMAYRAGGVELDSELLPFDPQAVASLPDDKYPYRLEDDASRGPQELLGWRRLLDECERDLCLDRVLTVVGDVGSGRRTLLQDIVRPILQQGRARRERLAGSEDWRYITITFGDSPLKDLIAAIGQQLQQTAAWQRAAEERLRKDPETLCELLSDDAHPATMLLFDRFGVLLEEAADERKLIVRALASLVDDIQQRFYLAVTIRRSQTHALASFGPLEKPMRDGHVVLAFTTSELRHFIVEPASAVGLQFEAGLVDQLLIDIQGEPNALPLLNFTLKRLWAHRDRNRITWDAYEECGGGVSALGAALKEVNDALGAGERDVLQRVLVVMATLEPSGEYTPCEVSLSDLRRIGREPDTVNRICDLLVAHELAVVRSSSAATFLTLKNKAILKAWPPLVDWLDERRVNERIRMRLKDVAGVWERRRHPAELLWRGTQLDQALERLLDDSRLTTPEQQFLIASRKRRRLLRFGYRMLACLILALLLAIPDAKWHSESQERTFRAAQRSLLEGDLSGSLLWLNDKADHARPWSPRNHLASQMTRYVGAQQPDLALRVVRPPTRSESDPATSFDKAVVSPDQKWIACLQSEQVSSAGNDEQWMSYLDVSPGIESPDSERVWLRPAAPGSRERQPAFSAHEGSLAFLKLRAPDSEETASYLVAGGRRTSSEVHAWRMDEGNPSVWRHERIRILMPGDPGASGAFGVPTYLAADPIVRGGAPAFEITDFDVEGSLIAITFESTTGTRTVEIYSCSFESGATGGLRLRRVLPAVTGDSPSAVNSTMSASSADLIGVHIADLSPRGDLIVATGGDPESARTLKVFRKVPGVDQWTTVLSQESPVGARSSDNFRNSREWQIGTAGHWERSGSFITSLKFSPDGSTFATACNDGQVLAWTVQSVSMPSTGASALSSGAPAPASRFAAAVVGDMQRGEYIHPLYETQLKLGSQVFGLSFLSEDVLATAGRDRTVRVFDLGSGSEIAPRTYHEGTVEEVTFVPPRKLLTKTGSTVRQWTAVDFEVSAAPVLARAVSVHPLNGVVSLLQKRTAREAGAVLDSASVLPRSWPDGDISPVVADQNTRAAAFSTNGKFVAMVIESGTPDSSGITSASRVNELMMMETAVPDNLTILESPITFDGLPRIEFSEDARWVVAFGTVKSAGNAERPAVVAWSTADTGGGESCIVGRSIPFASDDLKGCSLTCGAFAPTSRGYLLVLGGKQPRSDTDFNKEKGVLFVCSSDPQSHPADHKLHRIGGPPSRRSAETQQKAPRSEERSFPHEERVLCLAFSNDTSRRWLATGDEFDKVKLWNVQHLQSAARAAEDTQSLSLTPIAQFEHTSNVEQIRFSGAPAALIVSVSSEGEASVWDTSELSSTAAGTLEFKTPRFKLRHPARILCASFSSDGQAVLTGGLDKQVRVWNAADGELLGIFEHQMPVQQIWMTQQSRIIAFGHRVISANEEGGVDGSVRIWDIPATPRLNETQAQLQASREVAETQLMRLDAEALEQLRRE